MQEQVLSREVEVAALDLHATMARQLLGKFDPTGRQSDHAFLKACHTETGTLAVWRLARSATGLRINVEGAGGGLQPFLSQFPLRDGAETFDPEHPLLRRLARLKGLRLLHVPWPFDIAAGAVLQQRVRWQVGCGDFRKVALRWGTRMPGLNGFPTPERLATVPVFDLEALGIDGKRARALQGLARAQAVRPFLLPGADPIEVARRLAAIPGIGPWTVGMTLGYAYGDPDAVPLGDLHLPQLVVSALTGEENGTEETMLDALEPYRGQRFRVLRLLLWAVRRAPHLFSGRL